MREKTTEDEIYVESLEKARDDIYREVNDKIEEELYQKVLSKLDRPEVSVWYNATSSFSTCSTTSFSPVNIKLFSVILSNSTLMKTSYEETEIEDG